MPLDRLRRSALYTPGTNEAVLRKAVQGKADVVIFDLEDAVAPDAKLAARQIIARVLSEGVPAGREIVVRVNAIDTPWCADDVRTLAKSGAAAFLFPKIGAPEEVHAAEALMDGAGVPRQTELWCMIETPLAILNLRSIAAQAGCADARMTTWIMGTNDLLKEMRGRQTPGREPLVPALAAALFAARAHGLCILDGVHNDIQDLDGLVRSCVQGRDMGFDGRTLIHPSQIAPCHRVYSPSEDEVRNAKAILAAFDRPENQGRGVLKIDGQMIELLHAEIARQTVRMAEAIGASGRT